MQIISLSNDFGVDCNFFYSEVVKRSLGGIFLQFLVHCWLRRDESGSRNQPKNGFKKASRTRLFFISPHPNYFHI